MEKEHFSESNKNILLEKILLYFLFAAGFAVRLYKLGTVPYGLNQDEAFAGYNAYSLLHYGIDASGYHNPVYFVAWGSGMNALETYLMIPFIKWLGLTVTAVRLPQAILGCISIIVFYLLLKEFFSPRTVILGVLIFIACPWHIMKSRWALESNLLPEFLLYGFFFFIKGLKNSRWLAASAFCYGLSLYCYAVIWPVLPLIILLQVFYCIRSKKMSFKDKNLWAFFLILLLMALPLVIFLLVNFQVIPEINKRFISFPRLTGMRNNEIDPLNFRKNLLNFFHIVFSQTDLEFFTHTKQYGIFYHFSTFFMVLGFILVFRKSFQSIHRKQFSETPLIAIELFGITLLGAMVRGSSIIRLNALWIWLLLCIIYAIDEISNHIWKYFSPLTAVIYGLSLIAFLSFYFSNYSIPWKGGFPSVNGKEIEAAVKTSSNIIYFDSSIFYSQVLFYSKLPVHQFLDTVVYMDPMGNYRKANRFWKFIKYDFDSSSLEPETYILYETHAKEMEENGFKVTNYGLYIMAAK